MVRCTFSTVVSCFAIYFFLISKKITLVAKNNERKRGERGEKKVEEKLDLFESKGKEWSTWSRPISVSKRRHDYAQKIILGVFQTHEIPTPINDSTLALSII